MLNEEGLTAAVRAVIQEIQLRDFGHRKANGDFVTTGPKIDLLEAQARKAAGAAITAYLSTVEKPETGVTSAEIRAFRAKYREIFPRSHPDRATIIELLTASKIAVSDASKAFREHLPTPPASATKGE